MSIHPLWLPGWEDLSTWGYDEQMEGFYAQLTRNGHSDDDDPEIWITPAREAVESEAKLADLIAARTGEAPASVGEAMKHQ